ncbi:hypothetical protein N7E02_03770 (plasmid) [Aliirhizobium terrae]|uniref:hypothetical protein n=1 Tax=Terrirhizobium terrae TaxID=2926709 RepID=UPI002575BFCB|nr:hypothetical protein [Rhizobium sp. CC-CFT758]WJH38538.1 hypothetical protein N7E02_03770 [Rhizobium sp. CC-CFT758]
MNFTTHEAHEALEPTDLTLLRAVLDEICRDQHIDPKAKHAESVAHDLINLWLSGFRSAHELKAMLAPMPLAG